MLNLDRTEYIYTPIIKQGGFNPSPVAGRIPYWADSISNPKCAGTKAWEDFWLEQIYYCFNGYDTGGIHIPGPYYHYLNFNSIKGLHGTIYPHFLDVHQSLFTIREEIKADDTLVGAIIPKARRKGLSLFGNALAAYGMRFIEDYRMAVAGGLERYVNGFRAKLYMSYNNVPPELALNHIRRNSEEIVVGYEEMINNQYEDVINAIGLFKTLQDKASKLEGEFFHDCIFEEMGEFENSRPAYESIRPALEIGEQTKGTFWFYGTGGNMLKGSGPFKQFWHEAESYGLVKFFISGARYYFPYYRGAVNQDGISEAKTPILDAQYPDLKPEQLLGCEDVKAATDSIKTERLKRAKNPNKKALAEWNQKYPLTVEEVFTSSGFNNFNSDLLYNQQYQNDSKERRWTEHVLDFVKDDKGNIQLPLEVTARPAKKTDKEWEIVDIYLHPKKNYKNLDIGGFDGYNEDLTLTSKSLGGIVVVRRFDEFEYAEKEHNEKTVICHYMKRPPRKELHWDIGLKVAVYYGLLKNMMISAESDLVIGYFKANNGRKFLSPRPKSFESQDSKLVHDYGAKMTTYSKPRMLGLLQSFVEDSIMTCFFNVLIQNFLAYDYENIGTDWDDVDALGLALMRISDMKQKPEKTGDAESYEIEMGLGDFKLVNGEIVMEGEYDDSLDQDFSSMF
jgi:hypothetical protein